MTKNIKEYQVTSFGVTIPYIFIDKGNGEYTTMSKEDWEKLQAKQNEGSLE